jgi:peptidoglycan hydrolase CwlO-like protein
MKLFSGALTIAALLTFSSAIQAETVPVKTDYLYPSRGLAIFNDQNDNIRPSQYFNEDTLRDMQRSLKQLETAQSSSLNGSYNQEREFSDMKNKISQYEREIANQSSRISKLEQENSRLASRIDELANKIK